MDTLKQETPSQISHVGESFFPPATYGLAQKYDLPAPENMVSQRAITHTKNRAKKEFLGLATRIVDANPELPVPQDATGAFNLIMGVCSRIPSEDITFFLHIGGGQKRSRSEQKAMDAMAQIGLSKLGPHRHRWLCSPKTVWSYAHEVPGLSNLTYRAKKWAWYAYRRRQQGTFEYKWPGKAEDDYSWPFGW